MILNFRTTPTTFDHRPDSSKDQQASDVEGRECTSFSRNAPAAAGRDE